MLQRRAQADTPRVTHEHAATVRQQPEFEDPAVRVRVRGLGGGAVEFHASTHSSNGRKVLPPEWDLTPSEYRTLVQQRDRPTGEDAFFAVVSVVAPLALTSLFVWLVANPQAAADTLTGPLRETLDAVESAPKPLPDEITAAFGFAERFAPFFIVYAVAVAFKNGYRNLPDLFGWLAQIGRPPSAVLDSLDPAAALGIDTLPDEIAALVYYLANDHGPRPVPHERAERLLVAYECTLAFSEALVGKGKPTIATLVRECPEALERLLAYCETPSGGSRAFAEKHRVNTIKVVKAALVMGRRDTTSSAAVARSTSRPSASKQPTVQPPAPAARAVPAESGESFRTQRWADAVARHDRISDAWADIITDPLAALDHSLLLDVTQPRTAKFIETYGRAQDLRALHGTTYPTKDEVVADYLSIVRQTDEAWSDAVRHARHVHLAWLPESEAKRVRQASALLATAADKSQPMHLRADSAAKAAELLAKVTSFYLPEPSATAIETQARLALPAGPTTTPAAQPTADSILEPVPESTPVPVAQPKPVRRYLPMDGTVY